MRADYLFVAEQFLDRVGDGDRLGIGVEPHRHDSGAGRTASAIRDSSPFTKRPESFVEYCFASSTASVIDGRGRDVGHPAQLEGADAQQRAVEHRHPFERPVLGVLADHRVDLVAVRFDAEHELLRVLVGCDGEFCQQRRAREIALLALVGEAERSLSCLTPRRH